MNDSMWKLYMKVVHGAGTGDPHSWAKLDLTMPQLKILILLRFSSRLSVSTLAEVMNTSLSNMTGILDRLEGHGFVARVPSVSDRRSVFVKLTSQAQDIFDQIDHSGQAKFYAAIGRLTETEQRMVELGLQILAEAFEKPIEANHVQEAPIAR
ncbi:putative HTH-type transcriptional regulator YfiV [Paenibacillus sp. J31TS4]|uniref:MarR family transcriptional regulator n=1 Tax=Paenibacillus sp. J31TS4 TaxID=2807195 RepID=UPI001B2BCDF3|nr:MarR family transcriptional regulator [Paenibacillus sp. J31TS4]GIP40395.1 putative HTH-type transcriptional regulator YfiV [Paenibacillus sp. J31TS4]